jgi:hypothetical protein
MGRTSGRLRGGRLEEKERGGQEIKEGRRSHSSRNFFVPLVIEE